MNRDINNFREITNSIIEDIHVTEELKLSTLKKCREQKKHSIKPFIVTAASIAVVTFSIVSYRFLFHNPSPSLTYNKETPNKTVSFNDSSAKPSNEKNKLENSVKSVSNDAADTSNKKQIQQNNSSTNQDKSNVDNTNLHQSSNKPEIALDKSKGEENSLISPPVDDKAIIDPSKNVTVNNNIDSSKEASSSASENTTISSSTASKEIPTLKAALVESSKPMSIADAENFWGGKLLIPSYIPEGFELTDISLPKNDSKEIYVKLNYSFKNIYFKIIQNKSTTSTSYVGTTVDINGSKAFITKNKDVSNPSIITTEINLVKNNIQYTITGNLQEDELIKITKSIN